MWRPPCLRARTYGQIDCALCLGWDLGRWEGASKRENSEMGSSEHERSTTTRVRRALLSTPGSPLNDLGMDTVAAIQNLRRLVCSVLRGGKEWRR